MVLRIEPRASHMLANILPLSHNSRPVWFLLNLMGLPPCTAAMWMCVHHLHLPGSKLLLQCWESNTGVFISVS